MALPIRKASHLEESEDDHLSDMDYNRLSSLIGNLVGIKLPPAKRLMVEGRLRKRVKGLGFPGFDAYCRHLFQDDGLNDELPFLINAVTTNKTDFFREPEHFECLQHTIVPALVAARRGGGIPVLKVWSAASSNGAEAYTIAMLLADLAAARHDFKFSILGTDISTTVLEQARSGVYPAEMVSPVPPDKISRYVMHARKAGARNDVRIVPELRRLVQFARLNLMDKSYPFDRDVDVVFLRNVLIYFEKKDQEAVITRLVGHLRPGGYLLLGHSESMIGTNLSMRQVAPAVFQKI